MQREEGEGERGGKRGRWNYMVGYTSFISARLGGRKMSRMSIIYLKYNVIVHELSAAAVTHVLMPKSSQNFDLPKSSLTVCLVLKRTYLLYGHFSEC